MGMDPSPDYDATDEVEYFFSLAAVGAARGLPAARLPPGVTRLR